MLKGRILIVEDNEVDATSIRLLLKKNNYEVTDTVKNGNDAILSVESKIPDLILMDINLPGNFNGIEVTKKLNQKWDIPVIFLTADDQNHYLYEAMQSGAFAYLTKQTALNDQLPIMIEFTLFKHKSHLEVKKAQEAIKNNEEKFRSIAATAKDAIIFLDSESRVSFWNDAATRIFGYSTDEVHYKKIHDLIAPEPLKNYFLNGFSLKPSLPQGIFLGKTIELQAIGKNGNIIPVELSLSPVELLGESCSCAIIRDISSRKETEDEMERLIEELQLSKEIIEHHAFDLMNLNQKLQESEKKLKLLNASKDKFFSIIAHDMKGLFQGLMSYSEILLKDIDKLSPEEIKEYAGEIYDNTRNLLKLFENLLHWSRVQRGILNYEPTRINLNQLTYLVTSLYHTSSKSKSIDIINKIEEGIEIFADVNMINTVLRNLISNAFKFTNKGGKITIFAENHTDQSVKVGISDTGIGIKKSDLEKLFKLDHHYTTLGTENEKGTGLGLILCKELIEKNNGNIWVESMPGEGTTFFFTLPFINQESAN